MGGKEEFPVSHEHAASGASKSLLDEYIKQLSQIQINGYMEYERRLLYLN